MATYLVSDLHGNLDAFKELLEKMDFKYDGSDELYLLGDYVDWGPEPLNTLLFVMELQEKYPFVHCLIGNHDLMFLDQIDMYHLNKLNRDTNWLVYNGGQRTWDQWLAKDEDEREKIRNYIDDLPYRIDIECEGKKYILAHACPQEFYDSIEDSYAFEHARYDACWERITRKVPSVIRWFDDEGIYENFICGHTITNNATQEIPYFHIKIEENSYIDIDCGAKVLGNTFFEGWKYGRLGGLRLNDMKEYYVNVEVDESEIKDNED